MKRLRFLATGVAVTLAASLGACGSGATDVANETAAVGDAAPATQDGGLTWDADAGDYVMEPEIASGAEALTVWFPTQEMADAAVSAFHEKYPDVRVDAQVVALTDAVDRMALQGEAGTGADVFMTAYDNLSRAIEDGTAAPLGDYEAGLHERLSDTFTGVVSHNGHMFAVPVTTESIALFYNKTLLRELTGTDEPAQTWEQIRELAEQYNDPATNRWTIRFLASELYYAYPVLSSAGWDIYPGGDPENPGFGDESLTTGLDYFGGLRDIWNVPSADASWDTIEMQFANGETPYVITGPWSFSTFDEGAAANGFEWGVTTLPKIEGGRDAQTLAGLQVAVVSGFTQYPAAARVFANFLASTEAAAAIYQNTGAIPALNPELLEDIPGIVDDDRVIGIVEQSQRAALLPQVPQYLWETGNTMVVDVWDRLLPSRDAQDKAVDGFAKLSGL